MEELIELKFIFKQMLKVSAFYLGKQKSLGRCQYQNKKALFTDAIFSERFGRKLKLNCEFNVVFITGYFGRPVSRNQASWSD